MICTALGNSRWTVSFAIFHGDCASPARMQAYLCPVTLSPPLLAPRISLRFARLVLRWARDLSLGIGGRSTREHAAA